MPSIAVVREKLVVALIALLVGVAVYTALGFAWTIKLAVETDFALALPSGLAS